jgi:regulator of protease activity HflC (stomatin/prohibitin superfamily)
MDTNSGILNKDTTYIVIMVLLEAGAILFVVGLAAVASSVELVKAYEKKAYTVFGDYKRLLPPGPNFVVPFVSRTRAFDTRTQPIDVPKQEAITQDNSPVVADAVVYIRVVDAEKAFLEVDDYKEATSQLAQTTLRAVLGDMELDDTLNKREEINEQIREGLAGPTDGWGIKVESVEVREVNPSKDVQQSMEKQTSAERNRRAMILEARGERRSAIEEAQGQKESEIIRAQGQKQSSILEAQGEAISTVLRAEAANAMGERAVIDKSLETLGDIGQGESTKYVIPQEMSSLLGRYGKHLTGSDMEGQETELESLEFDEDTRTMLGLDNIDELIGNIDEEVKKAESTAEEEIQDADSVVEGEGIPDPDVADGGDIDGTDSTGT